MHDSSHPEDQSDPVLALLERWREGDRASLDQLLAEVLPWLHQEVSRSLGARPRVAEESMDIVQTAVMNLLRWGPRFVPQSGAQFRALLKRIALNELIDQRRRVERSGGARHLESIAGASNPLSGFAGPSHSALRPSRAVERQEDQEWVRLALQFLDEDERYLLLASEVEDQDWAAIARELNLPSPDAARMRCVRLKPKLANLLRRLRLGNLPE